jgi:hypothetical protein
MWGRNMIFSIIVLVVGLCIGIPAVCGLIYLAMTAVQSDTGMIIMIICGALLILGIFSASAAVIFLVPMVRNRKVDAYFEVLGLKGSAYALFFRQYHGSYKGYSVYAKYYRGVNIELLVQSPLNTRMAIGTRSGLGVALSGVLGLKEMELEAPEFAAFAASAHDEQWAQSLISSPDVRTLIVKLLAHVHATELRSLIVQPDGVKLSITHTYMDILNAENVQSWFDDLLIIVEEAENLPPAQAV